MTNWKYNLYLADVSDEYDKDDEDTIDVKKCVDTVYNRLVLLKNKIEGDGDPDGIVDGCFGLEGHIENFQYFDFNGSHHDQIEQFDNFMDELYDFANWNFIWINLMDQNMNGIGKP